MSRTITHGNVTPRIGDHSDGDGDNRGTGRIVDRHGVGQGAHGNTGAHGRNGAHGNTHTNSRSGAHGHHGGSDRTDRTGSQNRSPGPFDGSDNVGDKLSDLNELLADMKGMLDDLGVNADGASDGSELPGPPGAPSLSAPSKFQIDDLAVLCENFQTKMNDLSMATLNSSLKMDDQMRRIAADKAIKQIAEAAKKMVAAAKKAKTMKILGILGKVFAVIAAAVMTVMTGGAAAPIAVALLAYAMADLVMTVADNVSQSKGGPSLSLDSLISKGIAKVAKDCGASDDEAKEIGQYGAMAVQIAIAIAGIGLGTFGTAGNLLELSETAMTAVKVLNASSMVLNGANMVASGGIEIAKSFDDTAVTDAKAEQKRQQAVADILKIYIGDTLDHMKSLVQALADQMNQVSDILQSTNQSNALVSQPNPA